MTNTDIDRKIRDFNANLLSKEHNVPKCCSDEELVNSLQSLFYEILKDYDTQFRYIPVVLSILEKNATTSMPLLVSLYLHLYESIMNKPIQKTDLTSFPTSESSLKKLEKFYKDNVETFKGQQIRISTINIDKSKITDDDIKDLIGLFEETIQHFEKNLELSEEIIQTMLMQLAILKDFLNYFHDYHTFYMVSANIIKSLITSQHPQLARDLAEEIILTSFNDKKVYYGYLNNFVSYSTNMSAIGGLTYANLSFITALQYDQIDSLYIELIVKEGVRFFRNIGLYDFSKYIYESIPKKITFTDYERRSLDHSYFLSLLKQHDLNLPTLILDYLNEHREKIFNMGIHDALPWLITLYNVKRIYPNADFSSTGLGFYLLTFEYIVPKENYITQKTIIFGDTKELKDVFKKSLVKLDETRYIDDVSHDNNTAILIASSIIRNSLENTDFEALILAALIKADFSVVFYQKERIGIAPAAIHKTDNETFNAIYGDVSETISDLKKQSNNTFIWLLYSESKVYQMKLSDDFSYLKLDNWNYKTFKEAISSKFFSKFNFDTTIKTEYEVRNLLPEEHINESIVIKENLLFSKLLIQNDKRPLLIVLDMELAGFPHNLFVDENENFIFLERPICNIVSTEWYLRFSDKTKFNANYSKSIWIPTMCGDFTINMLFSKIENCLKQYTFNFDVSEKPNNPIASELNIIVSHGSNDIAIKPALYPDQNPRLDLSKYIGKGKVLIFFVCHSGSTQETPFANSISSIVKDYLMDGYCSVIAPFWSMHVDIAPIWLPAFLDVISKGETIISAVHSANIAVYDKFPTVAAWGCMHLYGDPHISI
ncbi:hypothetical protein FACS1894159_01960 [Bacteroidia bacterium]|nr:hypothetical protein FACS1894159_01960 [Bacteroidia bacterium]